MKCGVQLLRNYTCIDKCGYHKALGNTEGERKQDTINEIHATAAIAQSISEIHVRVTIP